MFGAQPSLLKFARLPPDLRPLGRGWESQDWAGAFRSPWDADGIDGLRLAEALSFLAEGCLKRGDECIFPRSWIKVRSHSGGWEIESARLCGWVSGANGERRGSCQEQLCPRAVGVPAGVPGPWTLHVHGPDLGLEEHERTLSMEVQAREGR